MSKKLELEKERYRIVAMISEGFLFEYHVDLKMLYIFDGSVELPENMRKVENFRYNKIILNMICQTDLDDFYEFCNELDSGKQKHSVELRLVNKIGVSQWHRVEGITLYDEKNRPVKVIGKIYNIDVQKKEKQKLKEKAERDPLTTLYNKTTTEKQITKCLKGEETEPCLEGALLLIDFDNFKCLNDNLGHLFGDSVLREVSARLKELFRNTDILGRVGGDEFVAYIHGTCSEKIVAQKAVAINKIFDGLYADKEKRLASSCSIGIALAANHGKTYKELFKKADIALYQAKSRGKGCYQIFNEEETNQNILDKKDLFYTYETKEEQAPKEKCSIDETVRRIFDLLFGAQESEITLKKILAMIGVEYNFSQVSITELSADKKNELNTYGWAENSIFWDSIQQTQVELQEFEEWKELFNADGVLYISHISELKDISEKMYQYFENRGIKSVFQYAFLEENTFHGFIGFCDCNKNRSLKKKELFNLSILSKMIGNYVIQMRFKKRYKEEQQLLKEITKNQNLITYILKPNSFELMYVNENTRQVYPEAEVGKLCYQIFQNSDIPCENCPLYGLSEEKSSNIVDFYNSLQDIRLKATATRVQWGENDGILVCSSEVTDFIEIIQGRDDLTGLPSLSRFEKNANQLLEKGVEKYVLLSIDIDKFKNINSTLGYQEGNKMLITIVNTISSNLQIGELFCRSTADKFVILLGYNNYEAVSERVSKLIDTVTNYLRANYSNLHIAIACGMYITNTGDRQISLAVDKANIARKSIKGSHRSKIAVYDDKIHKKVVQEKEIEERMVSALGNDEFVVYLQPKVDLKTRKIVGAEALVRWRTQTDILIPPKEFIPLFEKNGFISQLDFYVYEKVFEKMQEWMRKGQSLIPISINISRVHVSDKQFVCKMRKLADTHNIPPDMVELEITESIFLSDTQPLISLLDELKAIGFHLSIDDFGAGYSSLNLLRHLQMDVLKLDKDFFDRVKITEKENIVLVNVVRMAKELGMIVLSEGVETEEQVKYLTSIGCDLAQGFYFARPIPIPEFEILLGKN